MTVCSIMPPFKSGLNMNESKKKGLRRRKNSVVKRRLIDTAGYHWKDQIKVARKVIWPWIQGWISPSLSQGWKRYGCRGRYIRSVGRKRFQTSSFLTWIRNCGNNSLFHSLLDTHVCTWAALLLCMTPVPSGLKTSP